MTPGEVEDWLTGQLATRKHGQADLAEIRQAAESAGITPSRLDAARKRLGIVTERSGFKNVTTTWKLPPDAMRRRRRRVNDDAGHNVHGVDGAAGAAATVRNSIEARVDALRDVLSILATKRTLTEGELRRVREVRLWLTDTEVDAWARTADDVMVRLDKKLAALSVQVIFTTLKRLGIWHDRMPPAEWDAVVDVVAAVLGIANSDPAQLVSEWPYGARPLGPSRPPGTRCSGPQGTPGAPLCARWPGCRFDAAGNWIEGTPDCEWPACKPERCTEHGNHVHTPDGAEHIGRVVRELPPGAEL